jgi:three-Cys-motif partner protein
VAERPWGFWTESKLDMLSAYLPAFTTASKRAPSTVYLDLFAGQATNVSRDTNAPIEGSLLRAVQTTPPFTVVHGFELRHTRARSLQEAFRAEFPDRDVVVHAGDVHDALPSALATLAPYRRSPTFAFIDPDGVEARWKLLEALAAHKAPGQTKVELFLLLASPQIVRVVNDSLDPDDLKHAVQQVTDLFGSTEWRAILDGRQSGALDAERTRDELTNLMRWRMEQTLGYGFTHTLRLTNINGVPLYNMIFASRKPVPTHSSRTKSCSETHRFAPMSPTSTPRRFLPMARSSGTRASPGHRRRHAHSGHHIPPHRVSARTGQSDHRNRAHHAYRDLEHHHLRHLLPCTRRRLLHPAQSRQGQKPCPRPASCGAGCADASLPRRVLYPRLDLASGLRLTSDTTSPLGQPARARPPGHT